jgi:ADP-ribose pyrophosphatase YjhB (NUDIX family)
MSDVYPFEFKKYGLSLAIGLGIFFLINNAIGQSYPNKPIKAIVPFAAGSATDQIGRAFTQKMAEILGQVIIVENKAGVNGMLGADLVAKSAPDGYTILIGTNSTNAALKSLKTKLRIEPIGFELLPQKFTLGQLQRVYETILGTQLDKRNFRRKILNKGFIQQLEEKQKGVPHKRASLFEFDQSAYDKLRTDQFNFEF